jgi:hypothetical protein
VRDGEVEVERRRTRRKRRKEERAEIEFGRVAPSIFAEDLRRIEEREGNGRIENG